MTDLVPSSDGAQWPGEYSKLEAPHSSWRRMRSVVLASLVPFILLSLGHYFSVTILSVQFAVRRAKWRWLRGEFWVFEDAMDDVDVFIFTEMAVAAVSFAMLCLSGAAAMSESAAINSGRRPSLGEVLREVKGVWREPSITRVYWTILLLGYVLSRILVVAVVLLISGGETSWRNLQLLLSFLALLLCVFFGVVGSVGTGSFLLEDGAEGLEALRGLAARMEEGKLHGFLIFFLSLVLTHGFLVSGGLWTADVLYRVEVAGIQLSPGPVLMNAIWMLGAGGLFGYAGVVLRI